MACPDLDTMKKEDELYEFKSFSNFLAILTVIMGNYEFIINNLHIAIDSVEFKGQINRNHDGITFVGKDNIGHYHFKAKDGRVTDSYKEKWQMNGTNSFCQTFAIMGYLGLDSNFIKGDYTHNAIEALKFIKKQAKYIVKYWKDTVLFNYDIIAYDYPDLNAREIREDIDCVIKNPLFLRGWLTNEVTYK
jgi:hypothetical protein